MLHIYANSGFSLPSFFPSLFLAFLFFLKQCIILKVFLNLFMAKFHFNLADNFKFVLNCGWQRLTAHYFYRRMLLLLVWVLWGSNMTRMISKALRMRENSILATSIDVEFSYSIESHWQQCFLREWRFFCRGREYLLLITDLRKLQNFSNYFPV